MPSVDIFSRETNDGKVNITKYSKADLSRVLMTLACVTLQ